VPTGASRQGVLPALDSASPGSALGFFNARVRFRRTKKKWPRIQ